MIDPDLKIQLDQINQSLTAIEKKKGGGVWRSFFNGMFSALGYVAGLAIVVVTIGWILQITGLLKPFQDEMKSFGEIIDQAKKLTAPTGNNHTSPNRAGGGQSVITLPNGQQYKVNVSQ